MTTITANCAASYWATMRALQAHVLVPNFANSTLVSIAEPAEAAEEDGTFSRDNPVEPGDGRLEQSGGLPIEKRYIEVARSSYGGYAADDGVIREIKKHDRRANLTGQTGGERKIAKIDVAEHVQRSES